MRRIWQILTDSYPRPSAKSASSVVYPLPSQPFDQLAHRRDAHREVVTSLAGQHPAWGHRKVWAMARHAGHRLSQSTVLRVLAEEGLLLSASYQRERRQLAAARKAAFAAPPTGPNMVWQFDFSEYETTTGGT